METTNQSTSTSNKPVRAGTKSKFIEDRSEKDRHDFESRIERKLENITLFTEVQGIASNVQILKADITAQKQIFETEIKALHLKIDTKIDALESKIDALASKINTKVVALDANRYED